MFKIKGLDHIVLKTTKLDKMLDFYCHILGCSVEKVQPDFKLTQLRAGTNLIDIIEVENTIPVDQHNVDHFCLQIHPFDYDTLKHYFESKKITLHQYGKRYGSQGEGYSFYLQDPQENKIELKEYIPGT